MNCLILQLVIFTWKQQQFFQKASDTDPQSPNPKSPPKKMQEKKSDSASKNPKKANLLDHHSIKHILDESVTEVGYSLFPLDPFSLSIFFSFIFGLFFCWICHCNSNRSWRGADMWRTCGWAMWGCFWAPSSSQSLSSLSFTRRSSLKTEIFSSSASSYILVYLVTCVCICLYALCFCLVDEKTPDLFPNFQSLFFLVLYWCWVQMCLIFDPRHVYSLQCSVAADHIHQGEECHSLHVSSRCMFSLFYWKCLYKCMIVCWYCAFRLINFARMWADDNC